MLPREAQGTTALSQHHVLQHGFPVTCQESSHTAACFPIHTVAASRLDICTENSKHLDLKSCFICNAFNISSIKSTVFTANLR